MAAFLPFDAKAKFRKEKGLRVCEVGRPAPNIYTFESQGNPIANNLTENRLARSTGNNSLCTRKAGAGKERCQEVHIFPYSLMFQTLF